MRGLGRQLLVGVGVVVLGGCEFLFPFVSDVEPGDTTSSSSSSSGVVGSSSTGGGSSQGGSSGSGVMSSSRGSSSVGSSVGMSSSVGVSSSRASSSVGSSSNPNSSSAVMSSSMAPQPPVGVNDSFLATEDTPLVQNTAQGVLANDTGTGTITATLGAMPTHGTLTFNADGSFTYTPNANYNGADSFTYTPSIGGLQGNSTTVNIGITAVNDNPTAVADAITVLKNTAFNGNVVTNDTDPDLADATPDTLTVTLGTNVTQGTLTLNGNGTFTYTPNNNYVGSDSFTYSVRDAANQTSGPVTVSINVSETNVPPVAVNDTYMTNEDVTLNVAAIMGVVANDTDVENATLTAVLVTNVATGTLTLNPGGDFTYVPVPNASGQVTFTYNAHDGIAPSAAPATVTINIMAVNDPPVGVDDAYNVNEDAVLTINAASGVLANDTDAENDTLTAVEVTGPTQGMLTLSANGSFVYTPTANFNGMDTFTYQASDTSAAMSAVTTVRITVAAQNDAPVAVADAFSGDEDTMLTGNVLTNDTDVDGNPLTAVLDNNVATGTLVLNANGSFTYTPVPDASGVVTFTCHAFDGTAPSNTVTVTLTVNAVDDPPVGAADNFTTVAGVTLTQAAPGVLSNDTDVDTVNLTAVMGTTMPTKGLVTLNANGSFTYNTTDKFQTGTDTFSYRASDGTSQSAETLVTITITPQQRFFTTLTGSQQPTPIVTTATGTATCDLNPVARTLECTGTHSTQGVSQCHVHQEGVLRNGGVVGNLTCTSSSDGVLLDGTITGTVTLSAAQVTQLQAGNAYINIHTALNGGGEIRGQLLKAGESLLEVIFTTVAGGNGRLSVIRHSATSVTWYGTTTATSLIDGPLTGLYAQGGDTAPALVIPYAGDPDGVANGNSTTAPDVQPTWIAKVVFGAGTLSDALVVTIPPN